MAKSKPMKVTFENAPNLERVARAYARLIEQQEGVTLESVTWLEKRTGEVHVTELRKEAGAWCFGEEKAKHVDNRRVKRMFPFKGSTISAATLARCMSSMSS